MSVYSLIRSGLTAGCLALLCSCASLKKTPPAATAVAGAPELKATRSLTPSPVSLVHQGPAVKTALPTRSEQIARLVRSGTLVEASKDCLVFSQGESPRNSPGGLFEDAIVLGRLRGQLKKIPGLPETVPSSATVQGARAYLKLGDQINAELAARAIDSALKTDGVAVVHVTTAPEARL